jgi:hypothetical protein
MFMLFTQSALIFNRAHINKWWTFALEAFVLIHGVAVAVFQGNQMWPMFAFGFGAMIVLTQMHGLGLSTWARRGIATAFILAVVVAYGVMGRFEQLNGHPHPDAGLFGRSSRVWAISRPEPGRQPPASRPAEAARTSLLGTGHESAQL